MEKTDRRPPEGAPAPEHRLQMIDRRRLSLSGIAQVSAYDAYSATLETGCGTLVVGGSDIRVHSFSAQSGEAEIEGEIEYLQYQNSAKGGRQPGLLRRLLG